MAANVQGLQVELSQARKKYSAVIEAGICVTQMGQGVLLSDAAKVPLEVPKKDGEYMLWLFHVEAPSRMTIGLVFDTSETKASRVLSPSRLVFIPSMRTKWMLSRSAGSTSALAGWFRSAYLCRAAVVSPERRRAT